MGRIPIMWETNEMPDLLSDIIPALVVLVVLCVIFLISGARMHAVSSTIGTYVVIGVAIFAAQTWSGGYCPPRPANGAAFWGRILNWPLGFYDSVWNRNEPFRQFLLPGSCADVRTER